MSLAPSPDTLKVKAKTNPTKPATEVRMSKKEKPINELDLHDYAADGVVNYSIYGCGGAGKVSALRFATKLNPNNHPVTTIDTSGLTNAVVGVNSIRIANLSGSGSLRKENADPIKDFVSNYVERETFADVNIIIHSLGGGSGSVIGPMLIDEILRQNKIAIVLTICDLTSMVNAVNSLNTLKSLDNVVKARKGYLPIIIFDNSNGRSVVDRGIDMTIANLADLLDTPLVGLDTKDRLRFLDPTSFDGISGGIKLLNLSRQEDGDWEKNGQIAPQDEYEHIDAALIISKMDDNSSLTRKCIVTFRGFYPDGGENLIASLGYAIPASFIQGINATIHSFKSMGEKKNTKIESEYEIGETKGSMVL